MAADASGKRYREAELQLQQCFADCLRRTSLSVRQERRQADLLSVG